MISSDVQLRPFAMVYRGIFSKGVVVLDDDAKLPEGQHVRVEIDEPSSDLEGSTAWRALLELAGSCPGLPPDMAENHDHYLYGVPKRDPKK
jgi:hypothetical protein